MTGFGVGVVSAVAWGALAFGAVYPWAYWSLAILCAALGLWAVVVLRAWEDPRTRTLGIALAVVAAGIGVQAVSLPYSIVMRLSPGVDQFLREYRLFFHPASLHSLSLNQQNTLIALALFVAMSLLLVGLTRAMRRVGLEWLVVQVMGFGVALAVVGVVQRALTFNDPDPLLYGFWQPARRGTPFGPYINRNHFAGWMLMALPLVVGYSCGVIARLAPSTSGGWRGWVRWILSEEAGRPLLLVACALVMGMAMTLTGSRSGVAAFAVSMMVMAMFIARRVDSRRVRRAAIAYIFTLIAGVVAWGGAGATYARFELVSQDIGGRLSAWSDTLRIIQDFPLFGTGLGTYRQAMLIYQTRFRETVFAQAHNDYLQIVAEGGLFLLIPIVFLLWVVIGTIVRRLRSGDDDALTSWIRAGAVAGLAGIAAQSLVEFTLQIPGNRVIFVVLVAIAMHRPVSIRQPRAETRRSPEAGA
ncbi:MAG: O-antigen ligase family protein [Vicinamibacterales bacterium]